MPNEEKLIENVESRVEELKEKFIKISRKRNKEWAKLLFFGEKYLHYLLYKSLNTNVGSYKIKWEYPTTQKYTKENEKLIRNEKGKPAYFDIAILDRDDGIIAALEFSLDFEIDEPIKKSLKQKTFREHVNRDFEKLACEKNGVKYAYILSFVYRGRQKRSGEGKQKKKEDAYQDHKVKCKTHFKKISQERSKLKILFVEVDEQNKKIDTAFFPEGCLT